MRVLCEASPAQSSPFGGRLISSPEKILLSPISNLRSSLHAVPHQELNWRLADSKGVQIVVRRDDLIHPALGGNKLYKLWGHVQQWLASGKQAIASCGGAYSNHLYALAAFGKLANIPTAAVIRGERSTSPSQTLLDLERMGMYLHFVSRSEYRDRPALEWINTIEHRLECSCYWVPEGGAGEPGIKACTVLGEFLGEQRWHKIFHACGTGTTAQGLAQGLVRANSLAELVGVSVLRSRSSIADKFIKASKNGVLNWSITNQYHCGGYAKSTSELDQFRADFEQETKVGLDKVYTAKVFYALANMLHSGRIAKGEKVLVIHSGGLQGNREA